MIVVRAGEEVNAGSIPSFLKRNGRLAPTRFAVSEMHTMVMPKATAIRG